MESLINTDLERGYECVMASLPIAAVRLSGSEYIIEDANAIALNLLKRDDRFIGAPLIQAIPELENQAIAKCLRDIFSTDTLREVVGYLYGGDFRKKYFKFSFKRISVKKEKLIMFLSYADEHNVQPNESRLANLADSMPQLVWIADENGTVTYYSNQVRHFAGAKQTDDGRWQWEGMVHPEDLEATNDAWRKAVEEKSMYQMEHRIKMGNGRYRWHLSRAFAHKSGDGLKWYGTATDIQQLKDSENIIRESEERFRIMADATPAIIWALTPEGGSHRYLNKYALEYLGVDLEKAIEIGWEPFIHPDDLESTLKTLSEAIEQRKPYSKEHQLLRRDGVYRWFLSQGAPSYFANGELYGFVGSGTDIHEWKLAQSVLKQNKETLENLVKERTLELQRSNNDLQQFAHVASHDLKEPLRKIKTFSYKLQDEFEDVLNERGKSLVNKIIHSSDRMNAMINGALNYASLAAPESKRRPVDLNKVIGDIEIDLDLLIQEKEAMISYRQLPRVTGDPDQIQQLFYNLINNSLKFSTPHVAVRIDMTAKELSKNEGGFIEITIVDNGIGFNNEHAEHIFGTFIRLHSKDKFEGSGLGLAMCQRIVERHGGTITASGTEGVGSVFKFTLPGSHG